jgi:hypothetical protein
MLNKNLSFNTLTFYLFVLIQERPPTITPPTIMPPITPPTVTPQSHHQQSCHQSHHQQSFHQSHHQPYHSTWVSFFIKHDLPQVLLPTLLNP